MTTRTTLGLLACAAVVVVATSLFGDGTAAIVAIDALSAIAVGFAWWGARRQSLRGRAAWTMSAVGLTCWFVGDLIWDRQVITTGTTPDVSVADVLYIAGYPAFVTAIVLMIRRRAQRHLRSGLIDAIGVGLAAALAAWVFLVPTMTESSLVVQAVTIAYPLADVVLLAALAWLVLSPGIRGVPSALALSGIAATLLLDVAHSIGPLVEHASIATWIDNSYPLSYLVLALAACHAHSGELTIPDPSPEERLQPARVLFLGVALFSGPSIGAMTTTGDFGRRVLVLGVTVAIGVIVLARFVGALREVERSRLALSVIAGTDPLTGLDNRRRFLENGERLVERHRRSGRTLATLMIDIDRFKQINDTHGHAAGDEVLVELARRCNVALRPVDLLGRLGGDEFAVLLADCDQAETDDVVERLRGLVADHPFPVPSSTTGVEAIGVTLSIGVVVGSSDSIAASLRAADLALYEAKRQGRDRAFSTTSRSAGVGSTAGWASTSG